MISSQEALEIILAHSLKQETRVVALSEAIGEVLAADVYADRPFPPFHRVTMDGIAIQSASWQNGRRSFTVQDVQAAGDPPLSLESGENAIEIMTGAVLPSNCDAVIKVEECTFQDGNVVVETDDVQPYKNVHKQGFDRAEQDLLLSAKTRIGSPEIGVLATVGLSEVEVLSRPDIAIISTGDELVDVSETPLPHQIRRSNVISIAAELGTLGFTSGDFHLTDDKELLKEKIAEILASYPVLILSGGVSKGKFDFLPDVLTELGVEKAFHRISQRPGKPFWFGYSNKNAVFALPGNPVSAYMCFTKYIRPWLSKVQGGETKHMHAVLDADFSFVPDLTYFLQVKITEKDGRLLATPLPGHGSGDHANLADTDAFLELPKGRDNFTRGEVFPLHLFRTIP